MKSFLRHIFNCFIFPLVALTGLYACSAADILSPDDGSGTPSADFKVTGKVVDQGGMPIKGIRVIDNYSYTSDYLNNGADTLYTDADGNFSKTRSLFSAPVKVEFLFDDVDGDANGGRFQSATAVVSKLVKTKDGDGWYSGEYTATANQVLGK